MEDCWSIKKTCFLGIAPKRPTNQNKSTLCGPVSEKESGMSTFGIPFGIDVSTFSKTCKNIDFNVKTYTLGMFFASKNNYCPIKVSMHFHVFSKPPPGTVFRGSWCRSLSTNWICAIFNFRDSKKGAFGPPFPSCIFVFSMCFALYINVF